MQARRIYYWIPVMVLMAMIFGGSTDLLSGRHTSRFLEPTLRWLIPGLADASFQKIHLVIRKCGHCTEYALLALLLFRAFRAERPGWHQPSARHAFLLATVYAMSDEFHQYFVATREASVIDVMIDSTGAAIGLIVLHAFGRWRDWW